MINKDSDANKYNYNTGPGKEETQRIQKKKKKLTEEKKPFNQQLRTRSGKVSKPVHKYVTTRQAHLQFQAIKPQEYLIEYAKVMHKQ